jgi:hypothetical protein
LLFDGSALFASFTLDEKSEICRITSCIYIFVGRLFVFFFETNHVKLYEKSTKSCGPARRQ